MAGLDSVAKIKKLVFDSVFKRALDVASGESLHNISFEGDNLETCKAECSGSSSTDVYTLSVSVFGDKAVGKCSCPASAKAKDGLCKHVVALLLRRNDRLQEKSARSIKVPTEEAELDEYPVENIGSPEEGGETVASPSKEREEIGHGTESETVNRSPAPRQSGSRRALPVWMLGVAGSAESEELSKTSKPKRKAPAAKPPRAPPPPTKRARRQGQPLKVSDGEDEEEDPGEIEIAEPHEEEETEEPVVEDEDNTCGKRNGQVRRSSHPRTRRNREILKQNNAGEIESIDGDENVGARKGKHSAQRRSKSRRLVGKLQEVVSDLSENEKVSSPARMKGVALQDVTDDDLLLLAQKHVANESGRSSQDAKLGNRSPVRHEEKKVSQKAVKKSSKFSFDKWKEISSQVDPGALLNTADGLDLETLTTYSHQADSQSTGQEGLLFPQDGVDEVNTILKARSADGENFTAPDADKDSITNDMLGLIFGSSLSASAVPQSQAPREHFSLDIDGESRRSLQPSSFAELPPEPVTAPPAALKKSTEESSGDFRSKKKSSLKDRIKMLLD
ncbi:hypothetical protein R1flu_026323 [Riccia fluitans]|uniref:SWIM-type domain-containing protein n=1 Tax=Riccia fluitans TaxID=41844 RepID=A0ABD1XG53_9MARC